VVEMMVDVRDELMEVLVVELFGKRTDVVGKREDEELVVGKTLDELVLEEVLVTVLDVVDGLDELLGDDVVGRAVEDELLGAEVVGRAVEDELLGADVVGRADEDEVVC
jgi:hypothetical protein